MSVALSIGAHFVLLSAPAVPANAGTGPFAENHRSVPSGASQSGSALAGAAGGSRRSSTRTSTPTETLVITGTRIRQAQSQAPIATTVLTREDLVGSGARNLAEALEALPGLRVIPDVTGAVQVQLRGFNSDHVLVLVDGQRVAGRKNGALDLGRLGVERIERIEVVKGPASALYGADALAGVINIITRAPARRIEGDLRVSYGAAPGSDISDLSAETFEGAARVGGRAGNIVWQGVGGYRRRGAFDLTPDTPGSTGSDFEDVDGELSGSYAGDAWRVRLRLEGSTRGLEAVESGPPLPSGQRAIFDREQRISTVGVHLRPEFDVGNGHMATDVSWSLYDERFERDQRGPNPRTLETLADSVSQVTIQLSQTLWEAHQVLAGLEAFHQLVDATRFPGFDDRFRVAGFLQDEWTLLPQLSVLGGVRVDVDDQFGTFPTPRISLRYAPWDILILRASWGLGFKAPLPRDLGILFENPGAGYRVEGNPDLDPERTSTFNVSAHFQPLRRLSFHVEVFHSDITNLIVPLPGVEAAPGEPLLFTYGNVAASRIRGVEAGVEWRPVQFLRLSFGYDGLEALELAGGNPIIDRDRPLPDRAPHRMTLAVGLWVPEIGLDVDVRGAWTDARSFFLAGDDGEEEEVVADPFVRLDARAEVAVADPLGVFLGADNILDAGDPQLLTIPPRTLFAGVQSSF